MRADRGAVTDRASGVTGKESLPPELLALLADQPAWTASANIATSIGYNDNLLLSQKDGEQSAFARLSVETLLWHVPHGNIDYLAFLNADGTRFFSGKQVHHEGEAFTGLEWRYRLGDVFSFAIDGQGYYLDQIFDISDTSLQRVVAELKVSGAKIGPTLRWSPVKWLWLEASAKGAKENLDEIVVDSGAETHDHPTLMDPTVRVGWRPSDRVDFSLSGTDRRRRYASHPRYTITGKIDSSGVLAVREREAEGRLDVQWGAGRHWKTSTRAGVLHYMDNGSGYLNYHQRGVSQEIEWSVGDWLVHAEGNARHKKYENQTENHEGEVPGTAILPPLIKDEYTTELRVERKIGRNWTAFATLSWERTRSNEDIACYRAKEGLLGWRWNWEK